MNDETQNEMLSAYLDGELTPAERAQVEQLLSANPSARQLLEELRAVGTTLKSLPRQNLGVDLSENVLKIAKRRTEKMGTGTLSEPVPIFSVPIFSLRRLKNPRIWVWEAVIVAVVLFLLVYNLNQNAPPRKNAERSIAMAPKGEEKPSDFEPTSMRAAPPASPSAGVEYVAEQKTNEDVDKSLPSGAALADKQPVAPDANEDVDKSGRSGDALADNRPVASSGTPIANAIIADQSFSQIKPAAPPAENKIVEKTKALAEAEATDELLVVRCEITPEASKNHAFDKLLADNAIVWEDTPAENTPVDDLTNQKAIELLLNTKADRKANESDGLDRIKVAHRNIEPLNAGRVEIVYVEATPDQIEATLNGLSAQSDTFRAVSVAAAKDDGNSRQLAASGNRRREITNAPQRAQAMAVQLFEKPTERQYQSTTNINSPTGSNTVLGRAQRVQFSSGNNIKGSEQLTPTARMAGTANLQTQSARVIAAQQPASLSAASSARSALSQAVKQEEPAQQSQNAQEANSQLRSFRFQQSESANAPQMQRALFVLQVIGRDDSADRPTVNPVDTSPADASPGKQ